MISANSQGRFHDPPASARPFDMNDLRMWARVCERRWERHGNHFQTGSPGRNMVSPRVTRPWTAHPLANLPIRTCHVAPASARRCLLLVLSPLRLPVLSSPAPAQWRSQLCTFSWEQLQHSLCPWSPAEPGAQLTFCPRNFSARYKASQHFLLTVYKMPNTQQLWSQRISFEGQPWDLGSVF